MISTGLLLFNFCCAALLYFCNSYHHLLIEPLRGSDRKNFHLISGLKPGATDILSLRDKEFFKNINSLQSKFPFRGTGGLVHRKIIRRLVYSRFFFHYLHQHIIGQTTRPKSEPMIIHPALAQCFF